MLRKIVDYKKLDHELVALLIKTYPDGYGDEDIIVFKNQYGEIIEAVELRTDDILYLVKISKSLANFIANFEDNMDKKLETTSSEKSVLEGIDSLEFEMEAGQEALMADNSDLD